MCDLWNSGSGLASLHKRKGDGPLPPVYTYLGKQSIKIE